MLTGPEALGLMMSPGNRSPICFVAAVAAEGHTTTRFA